MKIKAKQYAQALFLEIKDKQDDSLLKSIDLFLDVLRKDNAMSQIDKIIFYFEKIWNNEYSVVNAEISSAFKLDEELRLRLVDHIKKVAKSDNINISTKEDKKNIGGFVLRYGDKIVDTSISNQIRAFKNRLLN